MNKVLGIIFFSIFMSTIPTFLFSQGGDIQITCEPGLRIYLDGTFLGESNSTEDGKYLSNISLGKHKLVIKKTGFAPKTFVVNVILGSTREIVVGKMTPEITVKQSGDSSRGNIILSVGSLKIKTVPIRCRVMFQGRTIDKTGTELDIGNIPVGNHTIKFIRNNKTLNYKVQIDEQITREIKADFLTGEVIDITRPPGELEYLKGKELYDAKNYEEADKWFRVAAKANHAEALYYLSDTSRRKMPMGYAGTPEANARDREAIKWLKRALSAGLKGDKKWIAIQEIRARSISLHKYKVAIEYTKMLVESGDTFYEKLGYSLLGHFYEWGIGVPKDIREAIRLYKLALPTFKEEVERSLERIYKRYGLR